MNADIRDISLMLYMEVMEKNKFLHIEMNKVLEKYDYLEKQEKAFIKKLVTGSIERCISVDAAINCFSKMKVKKLKPFIRSLLRISVYQILYMDNVSDAVAVDEAVKLAKKHKFQALSGFVNGILRNISRNKQTIEFKEYEKLEIPEEIFALLKEQYGDKASSICSSYLEHGSKGVVIRINRSKVKNEKQLVEDIQADIISEELGCYRLKSAGNLTYLPGFEEGEFAVQDTAACLPVYLSNSKSGDKVLELCAAPGGKTLQLLDRMNDEGMVISRDISESRCDMIQSAVDRCGFKSCHIQVGDARILKDGEYNEYDVCLVDAPCSGLGVIGSKPDIRFHFDMEGISELTKVQSEILSSAVKSVKKGGYLIYSTCTLNRDENEKAVLFAKELRKSHIVDIEKKLPKCFTEFENNNGCITVFPTSGVCEGFFVGVLQMDEGYHGKS